MAAEDKKLKYVRFGNTGLKVSELCLGAMTFGDGDEAGTNSWGLGVASEAESVAMIDRFVELGGNFIDTANCYGNGISEQVIGRYLADKDRDNFVIATKCGIGMGKGPNDGGSSRKNILACVDESLKNLGTDYIDIYQIHKDDQVTPLLETMTTLNDLVRSGKVRYLGASNFAAWRLAEANAIAAQHGLAPFVSIQPQYNLLCRTTEYEVIPYANSKGMAILPWSPLKGGWLSGRYRRGMEAPDAGSRVNWAQTVGFKQTAFDLYANDKTWGIVDELDKAAEETGGSVAQCALRWAMQKGTIPIVGAKKMQHLEDNLNAAFIELSDERVAALDEASANIPIYPYDFLD